MAYHQPYDPFYVYQLHSHPHHLPPQLPLLADEPGAINTLFVSGLPNDVKAREIHNLFRRRHGFESCQLKYTGRGDQVCKNLQFLFFFIPIFRKAVYFVILSMFKLSEVTYLQVVAFATFTSHRFALAAMNELNVRFTSIELCDSIVTLCYLIVVKHFF